MAMPGAPDLGESRDNPDIFYLLLMKPVVHGVILSSFICL
jgi:hypothetical protein